MKQYLLSFLIVAGSLGLYAQEGIGSDGFQFTITKEIPITSVKNQASSGTCWSFAGLGMIESELLQTGKGNYDLSEMFIVHKNYQDKAKKYIRTQGTINFSSGGSFIDVIDAIKNYGIVPDTIMSGLNYGEKKHKHTEIDALTEVYVKALVKSPLKTLSTAWLNGFVGMLDAYLGKCPESFTYEGKQYTPQSFAQYLGVEPDNYVSVTSFVHHPFNEYFAIEIPDNWRWSQSFNLPLDGMMEVINNAIEQGYTIAWMGDVSERGFSRKGIAVVPDIEATEGPGSDQAKWLELSLKEKENMIISLNAPVPEKKITQEMRLKSFDNYESTDDHGMLIYGRAKDQNGTNYYLVKNSWGTESPYNGIWYISETYIKFKTISILVNKNALSKDLKKKMKL